MSAAEREAKYGGLLERITRSALETADADVFLERACEEVAKALDAAECRVIPLAKRPSEDGAAVAPLYIDGKAERGLSVRFNGSRTPDPLDDLLLRAISAHIGLAFANARSYALERMRRTRAESTERIVHMMRDAQTIDEAIAAFASAVSSETRLTVGVYGLDGTLATRQAYAIYEGTHGGLAQVADAREVLPFLEQREFMRARSLPYESRDQLFGSGEGLLTSVRIDGAVWGMALFSAPAGTQDWADGERRIHLRMLLSYFESALSAARGFERVQRLARALSESNEFKDDLLAMLAHDFKGPVTVILGYCDLLLEQAPPDGRDELETVRSQAMRLVRLSEDAVMLAETQAGLVPHRGPVDLCEVLQTGVKAHNRDHRIRLVLPAGEVCVSIDVLKFNHVLDNLIMNALKYSDGAVTVRLTTHGNRAKIAVTDHGIGIPQSEAESVFSRFGRASNARRKGVGSGLGLYVSRKIVEQHGGSIMASSSPAEGTTFTITMPMSE